ncbi:FtsK/SpoIIIE domain-containing protein [Vagococcus lutrae]|uniref:FtsK/SpoIIIE domain-containing protein n=1 Tax=Vagococcus lutrae TaxID=81947 RepID=UPI00200C8292|nr:FtsK/SpoIIIE domain-containing protein [Vagococcus lutrae]MDT2824175.1 FtsK/SpoIIIE domain-containing protein [Vagococcus lutrae]UQF18318.1 FtsK/SpoIIIE domain-containing protein [Vagococcus lutrae]
MKQFEKSKSHFYYLSLPTKLLVGSGFSLFIPLSTLMIAHAIRSLPFSSPIINQNDQIKITLLSALIPLLLFIFSLFLYFIQTDTQKIKVMLRKRIFSPFYGNPFKMSEGEHIPAISVKCEYQLKELDRILITVYTTNKEPSFISDLSNVISASLRKQYESFAVTKVIEDLNMISVTFICTDVMKNHKIVASKIKDMISIDPSKIRIQNNVEIDLTTSGSILLVGKTRSGKTQAAQTILLQLLSKGPDNFGSSILIIDPKSAELSTLPYTLSPSSHSLETIIESIEQFEKTIQYRQSVLNDMSKKTGSAELWWKIGMKPSILFIDEFVAFQSLLDKRSDKNNPKRSKSYFENLLKRIITMGASTGSFVILSIAQANTNELSSMLRDAFTTKFLFRPTREEAQFLWSVSQYELLALLSFKPGDAWFTSSDGVHDTNVNYVQFPELKFDSFRQLGFLLEEYNDLISPVQDA